MKNKKLCVLASLMMLIGLSSICFAHPPKGHHMPHRHNMHMHHRPHHHHLYPRIHVDYIRPIYNPYNYYGYGHYPRRYYPQAMYHNGHLGASFHISI